jgi:DNA-binding LytR/AlgR family response regulator
MASLGAVRGPAPSPSPASSPQADRARPLLALRWQRRIVIVPIASIVRIEACDDHVLVCADRFYRHRETLADLCARLPAATVLRVHRSHAINVAAVRELERRQHGEYALSLADGSRLVSGRAYRAAIETAFALA